MNDLVSLLLSPSDFAGLHGRCRTTRADIEELIVEAAKSILVTAYTFDDPRISTLLATRAEEGVRVEVYLDKDQFLNDKYSRVARQSVHDRLIDAGARVHLLDTQPDATFHVKALIADNRKAVIGSANITTRGLDRNTEIGLLLEGPTVAHLATAVNLNLRQIQNERGVPDAARPARWRTFPPFPRTGRGGRLSNQGRWMSRDDLQPATEDDAAAVKSLRDLLLALHGWDLIEGLDLARFTPMPHQLLAADALASPWLADVLGEEAYLQGRKRTRLIVADEGGTGKTLTASIAARWFRHTDAATQWSHSRACAPIADRRVVESSPCGVS